MRPGAARRWPSRCLPRESACARRQTARRLEWRGESWQGDEGGIAVLGIGLCLCLVMLVLGGVSVHAAQVARVDVLDATDHAGAAAADRIAVAATYAGGVETSTLDPSQVQREAAAVLASTPLPDHVTAWSVTHTEVAGKDVVVTVHATVVPPVVGGALAALGSPLEVVVTSRAQAHLER